jgi:hypothetical protein
VKGYKLHREEVARQVHYVIREIYREFDFDGDSVLKHIVCEKNDENAFVFSARRFADEYGIEIIGFIESVNRELGIEYEKNLHDRFLFSMSHDESAIYFRQISGNEK